MWQLNSTFSLLTSLSFLYSTEKDYLVNTNYGTVRGGISESRNGKSFYEFLGIPFAKAPVGDLRFRAPEEPDSWEGIKDATEYGNLCLQVDMMAKFIHGDEDCLFLNVFTHSYNDESDENSIQSKVKLNPVIVFIHGGIFMFGGSNIYRPKYFMDKNVVLVTINYRLGSFGFLNMGTEDIQGNMGLKDQVMALKWVRANIKQFGGDPDLVTIVGESAGATSVHYHILSPLSKGLFHRAITQSGTVLSYWALRSKPLEQAQRFAEQLNCTSEDILEVSQCLRNATSEDIITKHLECAYFFHHPLSMYGPTIETTGENLFLSEDPVNIIKSGNVSNVPWINGVNSEEGLILAAPILKNDTVRDALNSNWTKWLPIIFHFDEEPEKEEIANRIREFYLGSSDTNISMSNLDNFTDFLSDRGFFQGFHHTYLLHGQYTEAPLYLYLYSYQGVFSLARLSFELSYTIPAVADFAVTFSWQWISENIFGIKKQQFGTCHADELPLLFNFPFQPLHKKGSSMGTDFKMSEDLVNIWSEFAEKGYPPKIENIDWPLFNISTENKNLAFMKLSNQFEIVGDPYKQRAEFWKSLNMSDITKFSVM